jgi:hypothetical protein
MQCVAIPRFDVGSPGIHLAWTPPEMLGVSVDGYDIQRRIWSSRKQFETCISLAGDQLAQLRSVFELDTTLGPVLYGPAPAFPITASDVLTGSTNGVLAALTAAGSGPLPGAAPNVRGGAIPEALTAAGPHALTAQSMNAVLQSQPRAFAAFPARAVIDRITIELNQPTTEVRFVATAKAVAAFALRIGKVVDADATTTGAL